VKRKLQCVATLAAIVVTSALAVVPAFAQGSSQAMPPKKGSSASPSSASFDPHDLNGIWDPVNLSRSLNPPDGVAIYGTISKTPPPRTPWAQAKYDAAEPSYGPKSVANGNDPIFSCAPSGIPRIFFFPQPTEFIQTPTRTVEFFEREHAYREIYTDGRGHPNDPDPTWMGDSIGKWEGDTFVVDSVGFNDKAWLDFFGNPRSEKLHLIERWKRVDRDHLSLQLIVDDPMAFTKTWEGDTKMYTLLPPKDAYLDELFCIQSEEDAFRDKIRMQAVHDRPNSGSQDKQKAGDSTKKPDQSGSQP
jgi:hypothetical protein